MSLPDPADAPEFYRDLVIKRFVAWCVDLLITLVLTVLAVVLTAFIGILILPILWGAVAIVYRTVMLSNFGATAGMMLAAIKLRHLDGRRPDPMTCFWHAAIHVGSNISILGQVASIGLILVTPYRQALNDIVLGTTIINRYLED